MAGAKARVERQRKRKAYGGKVKKDNRYNAKGAPEEKEEEDRKDSFKAGGRKKKDGGEVGGKKARHRLDKRSRGGHSPLSSANRVGSTEQGGKRQGSYGVRPRGHFADGGDVGPNEDADTQSGITQGEEASPSKVAEAMPRIRDLVRQGRTDDAAGALGELGFTNKAVQYRLKMMQTPPKD